MEQDDRTPMERHAAMTWTHRLKRVFHLDISECEQCRGPVKIIACIEDPVVIEKILAHLHAKETAKAPHPGTLPLARTPPLLPGSEQGPPD